MNLSQSKGGEAFTAVKKNPDDIVIALAGNPNVGKSTVFNALTGMNQHTGNWPGKTVATAQGTHHFRGRDYVLVDLPGTYSIMAHSAEEEVARDFILFGGSDATIVVCDATCLERNLNLVLQILELTPRVVVCVNLMDEAKKKGIQIDPAALSEQLGVPVVGTSARGGKGLNELMEAVAALCAGQRRTQPRRVRYHPAVQRAILPLEELLRRKYTTLPDSRWLALRLVEQDTALTGGVQRHWNIALMEDAAVTDAVRAAADALAEEDITRERLRDIVAASIVFSAEEVAMQAQGAGLSCNGCVCRNAAANTEKACGNERDRRLDRILTSKRTGIPIMLAMLCAIFWLTINGANYPSALLADGLFWIQDRLTDFFLWLGTPDWVHGVLVLGVYRVLAWVISVMLPPMAIFFPLFTLLEDFGYLPRVAFNLDHQFKKAKACGKQALTMCMDNIIMYSMI